MFLEVLFVTEKEGSTAKLKKKKKERKKEMLLTAGPPGPGGWLAWW